MADNLTTHGQPVAGMVKLSGTLQNFRVTLGSAVFFLVDTDKSAFGAMAVASALMGLDGQAAQNLGYATDDMEEAADYLEFELAGKPCKGWVWRSPFAEGDFVNVAAEWQQDHYEVYAVDRPRDRTIAMYPHCSRGKAAHIRNAVKWWFIALGVFFIPLQIFTVLFSNIAIFWQSLWMVPLIIGPFAGMMVHSLTKQYLPFTGLAEKCFRVLGFKDVTNINLVKHTKSVIQKGDTAALGILFFRYP